MVGNLNADRQFHWLGVVMAGMQRVANDRFVPAIVMSPLPSHPAIGLEFENVTIAIGLLIFISARQDHRLARRNDYLGRWIG